LTGPLAQWIEDRELGITPVRDWSAEHHRAAMQGLAAEDSTERAQDARREPNTTPSLPLAAYAGTYGDSAYGNVSVTVKNGKLTLQRDDFVATLEHWHHDLFRASWNTRTLDRTFVSFVVGPDNSVETLTMDLLGDHMVLSRRADGGGASPPKSP
jgi:hypothetical protein